MLAVIDVLEGKALSSHDKFSFSHPKITSEESWKDLLNDLFKSAKVLARHIEELSEDMLEKDFVDNKYGTYYDNLQGLIEHNHYQQDVD